MKHLLEGFFADFVRAVEKMARTTSNVPLRTALKGFFANFVRGVEKSSIRVRRNQSSRQSLSTTIQVAESSSAPIATGSLSTSTRSGNPGRQVPDRDSITQHLQDQRDILYRLAEGEGIATKEWDGVLEKCYVCDKWMLEAVFKHHSQDCWHISDEEPESEPDRWGME